MSAYCNLRGLWVIPPPGGTPGGVSCRTCTLSAVPEPQKLGLSQMALGTYVEVAELSPPLLEHRLICGKITHFSWKTIVFTVHI